jgi:hypothetical protein
MEAQAVTAGPSPSHARIDIKRQDGQTFAIESFTFQLLANTAGAGGSLEIMPLLNGEDGVPNPYPYNATGVSGNHFTYTTPELTGFDAYKMTLYVDYALMGITVVDASLPPPVLDLVQVNATTIQLSWSTNSTGFTLESATTLPSQTWASVTNSIAINGDFFTVQVESSGSQRFYRLRK